MKKTVLFAVSAVLFSLSASAENIIINGDFRSAIGMASSKLLKGDATYEGGDGPSIDDGWVTENTLADPSWTVVAGEASRTANTRFSAYGFGQIVSNPRDGTFDKGEIVILSFDYDYAGGNTGLNYSLYGVTGSGSWFENAGDSVSLEIVPPEGNWIGSNYAFTELDNIRSQTTAGTGSLSVDITLADQYDYFFLVFWSDLDKGTRVTVDNVTLDSSNSPPSRGILFILSCITPIF